jgi:ferric-dicitrate binding protein FerR (iron transport regulator)
MTATHPDAAVAAADWAMRHIEDDMDFAQIEAFADWLHRAPITARP